MQNQYGAHCFCHVDAGTVLRPITQASLPKPDVLSWKDSSKGGITVTDEFVSRFL
jgi:hypothetical protein